MNIAKLIGSVTFVAAAFMAQAFDVRPDSAAALADAQKADKAVALHFRADWCPTCRAQDKVMESLKTEPGLDVTVLAVIYDTEKELKKQFNIRTQSTLVVLRGQKETGRSVSDTTVAGFRTTLKSAL